MNERFANVVIFYVNLLAVQRANILCFFFTTWQIFVFFSPTFFSPSLFLSFYSQIIRSLFAFTGIC